MSIAERARELSNEFCRWAATETPMDDLAAEHLALKFEQALLAERRLAMEAILEEMDLDDWNETDEWERGYNDAHKWYAGIIREKLGALRAAAEKEVSAPNAECPLHGSLSVQRRVKMQAEGKPIPCTRVTTPRGGE